MFVRKTFNEEPPHEISLYVNSAWLDKIQGWMRSQSGYDDLASMDSDTARWLCRPLILQMISPDRSPHRSLTYMNDTLIDSEEVGFGLTQRFSPVDEMQELDPLIVPTIFNICLIGEDSSPKVLAYLDEAKDIQPGSLDIVHIEAAIDAATTVLSLCLTPPNLA